MSRIWSYGLVVVVACFLSVGNLSAAEEGAAKKQSSKKKAAQQEAAKKRAKMAQEMFKKLDKNSDGKICIEEFKARRRRPEAAKLAEALFKMLDKNEDGGVCLEEFTNKTPAFRFKPMSWPPGPVTQPTLNW